MLLEELHKDEKQELIDEIEKKASKFLAGKGEWIWRGSKSNKPDGLYTPGLRKSANTSNQYTVLFDTNPLNKGWPKRSEAFIASTSRQTASGYSHGSPYLLIPTNESKIGQVNRPDLWHIKAKNPALWDGSVNIAGMNDFWKDVFREVFSMPGAEGRAFSPPMGELQHMLRELPKMPDRAEELVNQMHEYGTIGNTQADYDHDVIAQLLADELPNIYSWQQLGAEMKNSSNFDETERTEVWVTGPSFLVRDDEIVDYLMKKYRT